MMAITVVIPTLKDRPVEAAPEPPPPPPLREQTPSRAPSSIPEPAATPKVVWDQPDASTRPRERYLGVRRAARGVAYTLTALGLAGGASAGAFGVAALLANNSATSNCRPNNACNTTGVSDRNRAWGFAEASDISLAAGGSALAIGLIVLAVVPGPPERRAETAAAWSVGLTLQGLVAKGSF
jgi:hypothetical protein